VVLGFLEDLLRHFNERGVSNLVRLNFEPEPRLSNIEQTNAADGNISVALS